MDSTVTWTHASACPKQWVFFCLWGPCGFVACRLSPPVSGITLPVEVLPPAFTPSLFIYLISHTGLIEPQLGGITQMLTSGTVTRVVLYHHRYFHQSLHETVRSHFGLVISSRIDKHLLNKWGQLYLLNIGMPLWIKAKILILMKLTF